MPPTRLKSLYMRSCYDIIDTLNVILRRQMRDLVRCVLMCIMIAIVIVLIDVLTHHASQDTGVDRQSQKRRRGSCLCICIVCRVSRVVCHVQCSVTIPIRPMEVQTLLEAII